MVQPLLGRLREDNVAVKAEKNLWIKQTEEGKKGRKKSLRRKNTKIPRMSTKKVGFRGRKQSSTRKIKRNCLGKKRRWRK